MTNPVNNHSNIFANLKSTNPNDTRTSQERLTEVMAKISGGNPQDSIPFVARLPDSNPSKKAKIQVMPGSMSAEDAQKKFNEILGRK